VNQWLRNSAIQKARSLIRSEDRYTDLGVKVCVVRQDMEGGIEVKSGRPKVSLIETHRFGGMFDNLTRRFSGESKDPIVWYVTPIQWRLLNHEMDETRILCFGAEGSGKSHTLALYAALRFLKAIEFKGFAGVTAPTGDRLRTLLHVMKSCIPIDSPQNRVRGSWGTYHGFNGPGELRMINGLTIQFRGTHQASAALGARLQSYNWAWAVSDEIQDSISEPGDVDGDIEARLRAAPGGKSYRFCTATAKDSSEFRTWRAKKGASPDWAIERMPYYSNWSVFSRHWETMKRNLSAREWKRRCLAMDLPPENATYNAWERERNLQRIPEIGARDVTAKVLSRYGNNYGMLVGHDPGTTVDVSLFLRAYQLRGEHDFRWYVVDELTTKNSTTEEHASRVLERLQKKWDVNYLGAGESKALIRCDPYGDSANKTDRSVYLQFKLLGLEMRSAQYDSKGRGKGHIGREARIEMVNRLLFNAAENSRLFVACDENGSPAAPKLVEAFEQSERDANGRSETARKGTAQDRSHWPAALGYALWPTEKMRSIRAEQEKKRVNQWV